MNHLNAKRIGVLAASLLFGIAAAGSVSIGNIPIINSAGQPVVQVVVGSRAAISDGIVAANIAAVIGNLAFTSTPVTASVSGTSGVTCMVTTPTCSMTNSQVYLGESGTTSVASGSYQISALIGSVLNQGIMLGSPASTKTLATKGSGYGFNQTNLGIDMSPPSSPFAASSWVPAVSLPNGPSNGGGFSAFSFTANGMDNVLQITNAQLPSLLQNSGGNGESESLWLTGFPVYDQQTSPSIRNFAILSAGGAYQVVFNKPIHEPYNVSKSINNAGFELLGQNWTIVSYKLPSQGGASSTTAVAGGEIGLASSLVPMSTVEIGKNLTSGNFKVQLTDLGQPNSQGESSAAVVVYYNGVMTNVTSINQNVTQAFNVSGQTLDVRVGQTFAGLYSYKKWAKMQLFSGIYNITSGQVFNQTRDPGWNAELLWTNASGDSTPTDLQSIILYNTTPVDLFANQSYSFIQNPKEYRVTFVGDTLGSSQYDGVTFQPQFASSVEYANAGNITNVTEPSQELIVTSSIPNAFSYGGQTSSSLTYLLGTYGMSVANTATPSPATINVSMEPGYTDAGKYVNGDNPLQIQVSGYPSNANSGSITYTYQIGSQLTTANTIIGNTTGNLYNVTSIKVIGGTIPGMVVNVAESATAGNTITQKIIGSLAYNPTPEVLYSQSGKNYFGLANGESVTYNQQNGQPTTDFTMTPYSGNKVGNQDTYYTYSLNEYNVGGSTSSQDRLSFVITNSTYGTSTTAPFQLNSTNMDKLNITYAGSSGVPIQVQSGFRTERGSKVASVSPSEITLNIAKTVDTLRLVVGTAGSNTLVTSGGGTFGPFGIGRTNIGNVTIANVTGTCSFVAATCNVIGTGNVIATPSITSASTPISLNTATSPLVVADVNANPSETLIVVGSKYVNSVAAQIFASTPTLNSTFGASSVVEQAEGSNRILVAGYYANQTVQAGNQFIEALLASASSGQ